MTSNSSLGAAIKKKGRTISEVGHHKNVSNFGLLIAAAENLGSSYNPSQLTLQLPQLYTLLIIAQDKLASITIQQTAYNHAVNARKMAFKGLQEIFSQTVRSLEDTVTDPTILETAKDYNRKIHGIGLVKSKDAKSGIKLSYEQAVQLFGQLIELVSKTPQYLPEKAELSVENLLLKYNWLVQQNKAKSLAFNAMKNIRMERNTVLYHPETGLMTVAEKVRLYLSENFSNTPQGKQAAKLKFKKPKL